MKMLSKPNWSGGKRRREKEFSSSEEKRKERKERKKGRKGRRRKQDKENQCRIFWFTGAMEFSSCLICTPTGRGLLLPWLYLV